LPNPKYDNATTVSAGFSMVETITRDRENKVFQHEIGKCLINAQVLLCQLQ